MNDSHEEVPGTPVTERSSLAAWIVSGANALRDSDRRRTLAALIRRVLWIATITTFVLLFDFCTLLHWWAEKDMILAFLTFLPPVFWILPLAALVPLALPFSRRLAFLQCVGVAAYFWVFMDYETPAPPSRETTGRSFTILSYNRGQHRNHDLEPFVKQTQPDVIILQESYGRANLYRNDPRYADFPHVAGNSEHVILSKHPVVRSRSVNLSAWGKDKTVSARFHIDFEGTPIAVYSVHMPTLRDVLGRYRRGAIFYGLFGLPFTPWHAEREEQQEYWKERTDLARRLAESIAEDELPAVVAGDFNMPDHGLSYHAFAGRFTDAHEKRGCGYGHTFPGNGESLLAGHGPWLRLDYVFSGPPWETLRFTTEPEGRSQHRAIAATLALRAPSRSR